MHRIVIQTVHDGPNGPTILGIVYHASGSAVGPKRFLIVSPINLLVVAALI